MNKIKIGVIGTGSISKLHLTSYSRNRQAEIAAVCDFNESRTRAVAADFGAPHVFTDYRELLSMPDIEGVSICTWNDSHAEISLAALKAGKHVLVEKPPCLTVEDAVRIEEAARESGKVLQIGLVNRYDSNSQLLKQMIDAGVLGEIYYAKASYLRRLGNPGGWFADRRRSGGGPLIDLGVHVIDICWYMMGKPKVKSVSANTYNRLGNRSHIRNLSYYKASDYDARVNTVEDLANALIRFDNGASLAVDVSFTLHASKDEKYVKLYGDRGGAELEPELLLVSEQNDTILNIVPQTDFRSFDMNSAFQNEIDHFVDSIAGRKETLSPASDGVEIMKMLCGIYQSAQEGREVHW